MKKEIMLGKMKEKIIFMKRLKKRKLKKRKQKEEDRLFDKICDLLLKNRTMRKKGREDLIKRWNRIRNKR